MTDLLPKMSYTDYDPLAPAHTNKLTRSLLTLAAANGDLVGDTTTDLLRSVLTASTIRDKERALHAADKSCSKTVQAVTQERMTEHNATAAAGRMAGAPLSVRRDRSNAFSNYYNYCWAHAAVVQRAIHKAWSYARTQAYLLDQQVRSQRRRNDLTARRGGTPERIPDSGRTDYATWHGYQQGRDRVADTLERSEVNRRWRFGGERDRWLDAAPDTAERDRRAWPHGGRCRECQRHIQAEYEWCSEKCRDSLVT